MWWSGKSPGRSFEYLNKKRTNVKSKWRLTLTQPTCMNRRENRQCAEEHKEDIPQLWQALLEDIEVGHARLSAGILRDLQLRFLLFLEFMMAIEALKIANFR